MDFSQLGLAPAQLSACESLGYNEPTPIQRQAIPVILSGRDVIGCAETGTGKTAAFLLPIIQKISATPRPGLRVLVLAPTRELALQTQKFYGELNRVKTNRSVIAIGGANIRTQISELRRGASVLIATPGRLLDLTERGNVNLSTIEVLVFTRTRRGAERLSHILKARDHSVDRIHADRSQPQREAALRQFSDGRTRVLVATDIAARGLDVDSVSHVINYDVPAAPEDYVHRVGRTGRAGNHGKAITIVAPVDELSMRAIERLTGQAVKRVVPNGFAGTQTIPTSPVRAFAVAARTRSSSVRTFRPRRAR
jgi:ATP-dependent RNA helicase RhlE